MSMKLYYQYTDYGDCKAATAYSKKVEASMAMDRKVCTVLLMLVSYGIFSTTRSLCLGAALKDFLTVNIILWLCIAWSNYCFCGRRDIKEITGEYIALAYEYEKKGDPESSEVDEQMKIISRHKRRDALLNCLDGGYYLWISAAGIYCTSLALFLAPLYWLGTAASILAIGIRILLLRRKKDRT